MVHVYTSQNTIFPSGMPTIAYQVEEKVVEFSFLNEKKLFSGLQFGPISTIFKFLSDEIQIPSPQVSPEL